MAWQLRLLISANKANLPVYGPKILEVATATAFNLLCTTHTVGTCQGKGPHINIYWALPPTL